MSQDTFAADINRVLGQLRRLDLETVDLLPQVAQLGAELVAAEAAVRAPVDTGLLRDSIVAKAGEARRDSAEAYAGVGQFYGYFLEYGTSKMAARPFLRPAADASRQKIRAALQGEMRTITRRVTR